MSHAIAKETHIDANARSMSRAPKREGNEYENLRYLQYRAARSTGAPVTAATINNIHFP